MCVCVSVCVCVCVCVYVCVCLFVHSGQELVGEGGGYERREGRQNLTASLQLLRAQQRLPIWSSEFLAAAKQSHNIKSIIIQPGDGNASKLLSLCLTAH